MRPIHFAPIAAALALLATSARADEVTYPVQEKVFTNAVDAADIVTSDVTYPGPHAVIRSGRSTPVALSEEAWFPADPVRAPALREDCPRLAQAGVSCTHG